MAIFRYLVKNHNIINTFWISQKNKKFQVFLVKIERTCKKWKSDPLKAPIYRGLIFTLFKKHQTFFLSKRFWKFVQKVQTIFLNLGFENSFKNWKPFFWNLVLKIRSKIENLFGNKKVWTFLIFDPLKRPVYKGFIFKFSKKQKLWAKMRKIARNFFNALEKSKAGRKNIFMGKFAEIFINCKNLVSIVANLFICAIL